jgi:outer membrane receptor protein involved in Fe transport
VPREEIAERNEGLAVDLLRYLPGITIGQSGSPGGVADMFIRGGNYNFNLVQIDGVPVNSFGGSFDFAHIPTDWLERVEVIEGAQSSVYGAYANSGVVNFVTRSAADAPQIEVLAEGGTYQEHRFALGASGTLAGFGVAAFASQLGDNGPVVNSDYRNDNVALHVTRSFGRQSLSFGGDYNANDVGDPAPTVPIRGTISRASIRSAAIRTIFPITSASPDRFLAAVPPGDLRQFLSGKQRLHQPLRIQLREGSARPVRDARHSQREAVVHGGVRSQPGA